MSRKGKRAGFSLASHKYVVCTAQRVEHLLSGRLEAEPFEYSVTRHWTRARANTSRVSAPGIDNGSGATLAGAGDTTPSEEDAWMRIDFFCETMRDRRHVAACVVGVAAANARDLTAAWDQRFVPVLFQQMLEVD